VSHLGSWWHLANFLPTCYFLERSQETEITGSVLPAGLVTGRGAVDHPPCNPDVALRESSFSFVGLPFLNSMLAPYNIDSLPK